jgi:hypothetical protein
MFLRNGCIAVVYMSKRQKVRIEAIRRSKSLRVACALQISDRLRWLADWREGQSRQWPRIELVVSYGSRPLLKRRWLMASIPWVKYVISGVPVAGSEGVPPRD